MHSASLATRAEPTQRSSSEIYWDLRARLTSGAFTAGQRLRPEALRLEYGASASTMREVLLRLASARLVEFQEQRGFRVSPGSRRLIEETLHYRVIVECEGARLSIRQGGLEWEADLSAAHHRLAHIEAVMRATGDIAAHLSVWCDSEWRFHLALISACGSDILIRNYRDVYDEHRLHLVMAAENRGFRAGNIEEHKAILDAALARDEDACVSRVENHLRRGLDELKVMTD